MRGQGKVTAHRKRSHHLEIGLDVFRICFPNALNGRSREYIITNGSIRPIDDLAVGEDKVPPAASITLVAPLPLEVQPAKVTGERVRVRERDDGVLRVPVNAAVRSDVLQLENDRVDVGEGTC